MSNNTIASKKTYQYLICPSGASLAYRRTPGSPTNSLPGIIFLPGFMSDMNGEKALEIEKFAQERGQPFVRFDYFGHGHSSGDFINGHIGIWAKDALAILDLLRKTNSNSSMSDITGDGIGVIRELPTKKIIMDRILVDNLDSKIIEYFR